MSKKNQKNNALQVKKELSPAHIAAITQTEQQGTAMLQAGQQMFLAIEEILKQEFQFTSEQLHHFEKRITEMMETLAYVEEKGLSVQTINAMEQISRISVHIADIRKKRFADSTSEILLPTKEDMKKLGN